MEPQPQWAPLSPMAMLLVDAMLLTLLELFMWPRGRQRLSQRLMLSTGHMDTVGLDMLDTGDTPLKDTEDLDTEDLDTEDRDTEDWDMLLMDTLDMDTLTMDKAN